MSYLVLARKYRPLVFADVVGQEHVTRPLTNALKTDRVAHAFLFAGARGVGKTTVARILAMALNCRVEVDERPCGQCDACLEIISGQAIDVFEIDGASNRGIDEVRELREMVKYLPSKGSFKVYIIDEVHMLTAPAFNALLKTLEEPPAHVVFIFATTEPHKVPATILSRCQRYDFKRITLKAIVGRLEQVASNEGIEISPTSLRIIARESEGSLRDSLSLLDQVIAFSGTRVADKNVVEALGLIDRALISGSAKALLAGDASQALELLDRVYTYGYDTKEFVTQLLEYFRSLVVCKVSPDPGRILDMLDAELEELKDIAADSSLETLNFFFNALLERMEKLRRSTRPQLVLEALMVGLAQVEPLQSVAELASRLEALLGSVGPDVRASDFRRVSGSPPEKGPDLVEQPLEAAPAQTGAAPEEAEPFFQPVPGGKPEWPDFLSTLKEKNNRLLLSLLEKAEVKAFTPETVELEFPSEPEVAFVNHDRDRLVELINEYLQARPEIKINARPVKAEPSAKAKPGRNAEQSKRAEETIRQHPMIKSAQEVLGAKLVKILTNTN
ncbi:MAG: DNA polymerase III subunit gamma/tau [Deltaproteobacteria bacterium]|nr:DNA polymerase III subunit gamma/tau [Deltaproteobacteria bacterium]